MPRGKRSAKGSKPDRSFGQNGVLYSFPQGDGGPMQIKIDFGFAPVPVQYYYADAFHLALDEATQMALLSFGRRDPRTGKFADRIEIVMPSKSLFSQFWANTREVEATVDKILSGIGPRQKLVPILPPESTAVTLFGNMIFVAAGEGESALDFYHLSPREIHFAKTQKKDMLMQAIVRIIISTALTKHFFDTLRPHVNGAVMEAEKRAAR